jgi:TrmH family RNA methyltransferase
MIPLYKLEKLPRTQKLRKIIKIFTMAEKRLSMANSESIISKNGSGIFSEAEIVFFIEAAKLLLEDEKFPQHAKKVFNESRDGFTTNDKPVILRALNNIKHILMTETGNEQADWDFTDNSGHLDPEKRKIFEGMQVYLEDIRSPFNVGAIFRTAESFGVEKIILSPFCADPRHRRAERTAMGCIDIIPWERQELFAAPDNTLTDLSGEPLPVFALETGGIPLADFPFPRRGLLIAGSEELGVSPRALAAADASLGRVSIPCYGAKASLNVSVAFGIALQMWARKLMPQK